MKTQNAPQAHSLEKATASLAFRRRTQAAGCPLRFQPCLVEVAGGYAVVEVGQAEKQALKIVG